MGSRLEGGLSGLEGIGQGSRDLAQGIHVGIQECTLNYKSTPA